MTEDNKNPEPIEGDPRVTSPEAPTDTPPAIELEEVTIGEHTFKVQKGFGDKLRQPAPPAVQAPAAPAPVAAPAAPAAPVRAEVGLACPGYAQIIQDMMAGAFDRYGITGVVKVRMLVRGGQVVEASVLSGPREYHRLAVSAARRMKCQASGADEVQVNFEISLREE